MVDGGSTSSLDLRTGLVKSLEWSVCEQEKVIRGLKKMKSASETVEEIHAALILFRDRRNLNLKNEDVFDWWEKYLKTKIEKNQEKLLLLKTFEESFRETERVSVPCSSVVQYVRAIGDCDNEDVNLEIHSVVDIKSKELVCWKYLHEERRRFHEEKYGLLSNMEVREPDADLARIRKILRELSNSDNISGSLPDRSVSGFGAVRGG